MNIPIAQFVVVLLVAGFTTRTAGDLEACLELCGEYIDDDFGIMDGPQIIPFYGNVANTWRPPPRPRYGNVANTWRPPPRPRYGNVANTWRPPPRPRYGNVANTWRPPPRPRYGNVANTWRPPPSPRSAIGK